MAACLDAPQGQVVAITCQWSIHCLLTEGGEELGALGEDALMDGLHRHACTLPGRVRVRVSTQLSFSTAMLYSTDVKPSSSIHLKIDPGS